MFENRIVQTWYVSRVVEHFPTCDSIFNLLDEGIAKYARNLLFQDGVFRKDILENAV